MKNLTKTAAILIATLALSTTLFAQSSASADVTVAAQLTKGLSISKVGGDLDFSEIILTAGATATPAITEANGAKIQVTGHPNKNVTVSFSNVTLNNNTWVTNNGGTNDNVIFTPAVQQTGSNSTYTSAAAVSSGNQIGLVNVSGDGILYFWVGGSLDIAADQAQGDYAGTFTMTVEY